jgi:hypothetical protein
MRTNFLANITNYSFQESFFEAKRRSWGLGVVGCRLLVVGFVSCRFVGCRL